MKNGDIYYVNANITYHDTREIFENGKIINYTGDLRAIYEKTNQNDCMEYLLKKIVAKEPITEELIKKVHKILTKGIYDETRYNNNGERPGEYKKHDCITSRNEVGVAFSSVAAEIQNLVSELNNIIKHSQ